MLIFATPLQNLVDTVNTAVTNNANLIDENIEDIAKNTEMIENYSATNYTNEINELQVIPNLNEKYNITIIYDDSDYELPSRSYE